MDPRWDRRVRLAPRGASDVWIRGGACGPASRRHGGGPRTIGAGPRHAAPEAPEPPPDNAVLSWLRGLPGAPAAQLDRLRVLDRALAAVFGEALDLRDAGKRMAFALFVEFARHHGLSAGEAALLVPEPMDAARRAIDALADAAETRAIADTG